MLLIHIITNCKLWCKGCFCEKKKNKDKNKNRKMQTSSITLQAWCFLLLNKYRHCLKKWKQNPTNSTHFYCLIIIRSCTTWIKNPSYEYTPIHFKFITKEKQVVGIPTKYYIYVGKKQIKWHYCRNFESKWPYHPTDWWRVGKLENLWGLLVMMG